MEFGTPATLREAIERALMEGPLNQVNDRTRQAVKDFLAQRFGAKILKAEMDGHEVFADMLKELFNDVIREKL